MYISMKMITDIVPRIREVNKIIADCSSGTMPFEQAFVLARFYYDFQDTNAIIAEAEAMAADDLDGLRDIAVSLKAGTALLLNNIGLLDGIDFREIANAHSRYYHTLFQKASDELNPYWKRYCELNNRLDYLPLESEYYKETEKECEAAKAEHDRRQADVKEIYAEYERENRRGGNVFSLKAPHLYALAAKLDGIAASIIHDIDRMEKGGSL